MQSDWPTEFGTDVDDPRIVVALAEVVAGLGVLIAEVRGLRADLAQASERLKMPWRR